MTRRPAVVLLSGGLASATVLAIAQEQGFECHGLSFRYGQRHLCELEAATRVAAAANIGQHVVVDIDLRMFGGSALTADIEVPKHETADDLGDGRLSACFRAEEVKCSSDVFIGVNALDYSGYPDCRPEYIRAYEHMANLATKAGVEGRQRLQIHAPLMEMTKAQIITRGVELGVDYAMTSSCYDPAEDGAACGHCDSCLLRRKGFTEASIADPTTYTTDVFAP